MQTGLASGLFCCKIVKYTDWVSQYDCTIYDKSVARKTPYIVLVGLSVIDFSVVKCYSETNADFVACTDEKVFLGKHKI